MLHRDALTVTQAEKAENDSSERFRELREKFYLNEYHLGEATKTVSILQAKELASTDRAEAENAIRRLAMVAKGYRQALIEGPEFFAESLYQAFVQRTGWTDADTRAWFAAACEGIKNDYLSTHLPTLDATMQPIADLIDSPLAPAQCPQAPNTYCWGYASPYPSTDFHQAQASMVNDGVDHQMSQCTEQTDNVFPSAPLNTFVNPSDTSVPTPQDAAGLSSQDTVVPAIPTIPTVPAIPTVPIIPAIPASQNPITPPTNIFANPNGPPPIRTVQASSPQSERDPWTWAWTEPTDQASWKIYKDNMKFLKVAHVPTRMPNAENIGGYMRQAQSKVEFKHGPRPGVLDRLLDAAR